MAGKNSLDILGKELGRAFKPLHEVISNPTSFEAFMFELGWKVALVPVPIQNLSTATGDLIARLSTVINGNPNFNDFEALFDSIKTLVTAIRDLNGENFTPFPDLVSDNFANTFPEQLIDFLLISYLQNYHSKIYETLSLLGIINTESRAATGNRPVYLHRTIVWSSIPDIFSDPLLLFQNNYGWNTANINYDKFFFKVRSFLLAFGYISFYEVIPSGLRQALESSPVIGNPVRKQLVIPVFSKEVLGSQLEAGISLFPLLSDGVNAPGISILPYLQGAFNEEIQIGQDLFLRIIAALEFQGGVAVKLIPQQGIETFWGLNNPTSGAYVDGELKMQLINEDKSGAPINLIGEPQGTRLEYGSMSLLLDLNINSGGAKELKFELEMTDFLLAVEPSEGDSFLRKILPFDGIEAKSTLALGFSSVNGFYFRGSSALEVRLIQHLQLGPLTIENVIVKVQPGGGELKVASYFDLEAKFGPFLATVEGLGIIGNFSFPGSGGNLGPINADLGFKPPKGIGLVVDSDAVKGGGYLFFDRDEERYGGALELSIKDKISLKAIGILTTRLPNDPDGWSLLLLITAEFQPIQLGFGFTLNGVGGLVALHRSMNTAALQAGVRNNSLDSILFPQDPVANMGPILAALEGAFPVEEGRYSFGPMAIIGWGTPTLISAEVGLFIEVPDPVHVAILGVIKAILPDEAKPLLRLQVNFAGTIDFEAKYITFDASIFDSKLLWMTLAGDMAFRLRWGDNPLFLLSVGGFHPSFDTAGLNVPAMSRITVNLLGGENPRLTLRSYFAVTSNTVQFGALVDFFFRVTEKIRVVGMLGFDALFRFSPFHMLVNVGANLGVYRNDNCLLGVSFSGSIEGPTPWRVRGTGTFKIVIEFHIDFDKTFGDPVNTILPDVAVMAKLVDALGNSGNWQGNTPAGYPLLVTVRELPAVPGVVIVHPNSSMAVSQKVVPLDFGINKFGSGRPLDYTRFGIEIADGAGVPFQKNDLEEYFAPGEFTQLTDGERLVRKSFEKYKSGAEVRGNDLLAASAFQELQLEYDTIYMDSRHKPMHHPSPTAIPAAAYRASLGNNAAAKSARGSQKKPRSAWSPTKMKVQQEGYAVARTVDLGLHNNLRAGSQAEAEGLLAELLQVQPELEGKLQVVSTFELA